MWPSATSTRPRDSTAKSKSRLVFKELPVDDPVRRKPDISLAREHLGWEIRVQLLDGLRETIAYFRKKLPA